MTIRKGKQNNEYLETGLITAAGFFVVVAIAMPLIIWIRYKSYEDYSGLVALGPVGDFIGGSTIAFFNIASILLLVATIVIQGRELRETRKEYATTNSTMMKQKFENTFFNMLNLQNEIVNNMGHGQHNGRKALKLILFDLWSYTKNINFELKEEAVHQQIKERYNKFFKENENNIGHYLRNLYRIVKIISESSLKEEDKKNYFGILRAQWSRDEFFLIYLNLFSEDGNKFKKYVKEYDVLDIEVKDGNNNIALKENVPFDKRYSFLYKGDY